MSTAAIFRMRSFVASLIIGTATCAATTGGAATEAYGQSAAAPAAETESVAAGVCDSETTARLRFLEDKLEAGRAHGMYWWGGFVSFYGIGTVVTSVQAATDDNGGWRAIDIVSASKAAFGTARLLYAPPNAKNGSDAMRAVPLDSPQACQHRLDVGEQALRLNATEAERRYSWKQHAFIVGLNAAGAVIAGEGFGKRDSAWVSAGVGVAVGEAMTFLHPWEAVENLDEYQQRFPGRPVAAATSWDVYATPSGGGIRVRF